MPEVRSTLPYVSHLKVTKRPTQRWQATGYKNQEGQDLYQQVADLPGIECEITRYLGTVKGPATSFRFPLKAFFEDAKSELQALPANEQNTKAIAEIDKTLARTDVIWAESVLLAAGLPDFESLWADVFSDALDSFTEWAEPEEVTGIPVYVKEMQWDARIPYEANKTITMKAGIFADQAAKTIPTLHELVFEDSASKTLREREDTRIANELTSIQAQIATLPEGPSEERTNLEARLAAYESERDRRALIERGLIGDLLSKESVQQSLGALLMAIIGVLKPSQWPQLDMAVVQTRLQAALSNLS